MTFVSELFKFMGTILLIIAFLTAIIGGYAVLEWEMRELLHIEPREIYKRLKERYANRKVKNIFKR